MSHSSLRISPPVALVGLSLLAAAPPARAEEPAPAPPPGGYYAAPPEAPRGGWNVGVGLGGGDISCEGSTCDGVTEAGSLSAQVGNMLRPRLRLVGDVWIMAHTEDRLTLTHAILTAGLQYWIIDRLWLRGGVGLARASARYDGVFADIEDRTESVLGVAGAIGFEVYSRPTFAIDIELRAGTGFYDQVRARNAALGAAITWY